MKNIVARFSKETFALDFPNAEQLPLSVIFDLLFIVISGHKKKKTGCLPTSDPTTENLSASIPNKSPRTFLWDLI